MIVEFVEGFNDDLDKYLTDKTTAELPLMLVQAIKAIITKNIEETETPILNKDVDYEYRTKLLSAQG